MKEPSGDLPERLSAAGATDLERRLLAAAAHEQPAPELSKRMAQAIGISGVMLGGSVEGTAAGAGGTTSATGTSVAVGAGSTSVLPWISVGVLGLAIANVVIEARP